MGAKGNALGHWREAWWSEDEPGNGKVPYILSSTTGATLDSRWLYSSNYLRIKNLTLGYKLPINPKFISYARVYVSIENLAKWDSYYGGYSPEAPIRQPVPHPEVAVLWDWTMVVILHREFTLWVSTLISNKNIELCSN